LVDGLNFGWGALNFDTSLIITCQRGLCRDIGAGKVKYDQLTN